MWASMTVLEKAHSMEHSMELNSESLLDESMVPQKEAHLVSQ
jgi:hypothetical protein